MSGGTIPADDDLQTLAADLAEHGLLGTIVRHEARSHDESYEPFLENIASLMKRPGAPSVDEGIDAALRSLSGLHFFSVQNIVCDLIPRLNVGHQPLLRLVDRLVKAGGADLAAGRPYGALRSWCALDPERSAAIYADARDGEPLALKQMTFALEANHDVEEAIEFAGSDLIHAQFAAATALWRMDLGGEVERISQTLLELAQAADEHLSLTALDAGFGVAERANVAVSSKLEDALEHRLKMASPQTIHFAANLLWMRAKTLSQRTLDLCLSAVEAIDPEHRGTVSHLDHASRALAEIGQLDRMVKLVGRICDRTEGAISLTSFNGLMHQLATVGPETLGRAVVFWLLNGSGSTRRSLARQLTDIGRTKPSFAVPADALPPDAARQLFLCRKAVGWFFIDPLSAIPIPLSVLRYGASDIADDVLDLILDPLLLSYGGLLKSYLQGEAEGDHPRAGDLLRLIEQKNAMHSAAEGSEAIVELRPSERQREAERILWQEQMKDGMENASSKSPLSNLFSKQYILYGRSSLFTVHHEDGSTELAESEMKSFSVSSELPLLAIFDPAGLHHTLFRMKFEPLPNE